MPAKRSIAGLAGRVRDLRGWRSRATALVAGALSVLAMAPFFAWPILWITLPALVWLIDGTSSPRRRAATHVCASDPQVGADTRLSTHDEDARGGDDRLPWYAHPTVAAAEIGWWFGFGYFVPGLFWIGEAFLVEAETFALLLPFAVTLLPAYLALYWGAAAGVMARLGKPGVHRVVLLALALSAAEWLRGHLLSGFPWNTLGYALTYPLPLMQSATILGIYGLTLLTVLVFALPLVLWAEAAPGIAGRRTRAAALLLAIAPIAAIGLLGGARLAFADGSAVPGIRLRIVQPSVPQREKWRPENQGTIFADHLRLSATGPDGRLDNAAGITHVIWPEAAMPFLPLDHPEALAAIGRSLPAGSLLVTGALRAERAPPGALHPRHVFNSILVLGEGGSPAGTYDKIHLVPFGEYLPLQQVLEAIGLQQLSRLRGGFAAGAKPRPLLNIPRLPAAAPLVCYEAIFPAAIVQGTERPGLMLNVTNDGWFGDTTGPRQHLHQARVRAVEEGLPLVRAANNGISAVIDAYGHIHGQLALNERGTLDAALPAALPPPLYARVGDLVFVTIWMAFAAALVLRR